MANKYLRSTDGDDADDGSTWALANATMVGLAADMAEGDDGYFSQAHAESDANGTTMTITFPGTFDNPNLIICGNDAAEPPTTLETTGALTRTSTGASIYFAGNFRWVGGVIRCAGTGTNPFRFGAGGNRYQIFENVTFELTSATASSPRFLLSDTTGRSNLIFKQCSLTFGHVSQGLWIIFGDFSWQGGGLSGTSAAITTLFATFGTTASVKADLINLDLSAAASTLNICVGGVATNGLITLNRCKMPVSWTGGLFASLPINPGFRVSMYNCDSADTNYKILVGDRQGTLRDETTLVMTGGASESWKVTTTDNANAALTPFETDWIAKRNTAVGSAKTITVEILHDSTTDLTDNDIWLEADVLGTSGVPLGVSVSGKRGVLASSADHTNSSVTWTTTGMTNPNKQYLTVSVTPQEVGNIMVRVMVAKASYTVYINPEFSIT